MIFVTSCIWKNVTLMMGYSLCPRQAMLEEINTQYKRKNVNKKAGPQSGWSPDQV